MSRQRRRYYDLFCFKKIQLAKVFLTLKVVKIKGNALKISEGGGGGMSVYENIKGRQNRISSNAF